MSKTLNEKANAIFALVSVLTLRSYAVNADTVSKVKKAGVKSALVFLMNGVAYGYFGDSMYKKRTHDIHVNHPTVFVNSMSTWSIEGIFGVLVEIQNNCRHLLKSERLQTYGSELASLLTGKGQQALIKAIVEGSMPLRIEQNESKGRFDALTNGLFDKYSKVLQHADDAVDIGTIEIKKAWFKKDNHDLLGSKSSMTVNQLISLVDVHEADFYGRTISGLDYGDVLEADDLDI